MDDIAVRRTRKLGPQRSMRITNHGRFWGVWLLRSGWGGTGLALG